MGDFYNLETKVPHLGRIKAVKRGEMEYEYLLLKARVTTWVSHSDIKAMLEALNHRKDKDEPNSI